MLFIQNVVNNGTSLTIYAPNHGLTDGSTYLMYIEGGFTGVAAPFGYLYGNYTVSNITPNTFDIPVPLVAAGLDMVTSTKILT